MNNNFMQNLIRHLDDKDQIRQLLENNPNSRQCINEKDEHGDTLLHFASRIHNMEAMGILLTFGADSEAVNEHGRRPIHEVIDSYPCMQFLIDQYHVDVNAMKRGDWTPVMIAALKGNLDIVKLLTEAGAFLNRKTRDGRTALYLAVQKGHIELSKYLTDQYPAAITEATNSGRFPTQAAAVVAAAAEALEITQYLLSHAMVPLPMLLAHRDNSGRNILLDSAVAQNLELLKFLLNQGADANDTDSLGRNMIHHAAMMGHLNVLNMLSTLDRLDWNAPDTWDFWTPLMHAARQGHFDIVKYLMETIHVDANNRDKQGRSAQDLASLWHHGSIADYLASCLDPCI